MPALRSIGSGSGSQSPYSSPTGENNRSLSPASQRSTEQDAGGFSTWSVGKGDPNDDSAWQHVSELPFLMPEWTRNEFLDFVVSKALFSIPARSSQSNIAFFTVESEDARGVVTETNVPIRYRIPLLWTARYLWLSIKLVLEGPNGDWDEFKYSILHLSRLLSGFLEKARQYDQALGLERRWRDDTFDRVLIRFKAKWVMQDPEQIKGFYVAHGQEEYTKDVLNFGASRQTVLYQLN